MKTNIFNLVSKAIVLVAIMCINISGCATEAQQETFDPASFVMSEEPDAQGLATFGEGTCRTQFQSDIAIFVNTIGFEQTCNGACTTNGCVPANTGGYETAMLALELDDSIDPAMDCTGNCAPLGASVCGYATLNGEDYPDRWICLAWVNGDGLCHMKAVPNPCVDGDVCGNTGIYPNFAVCEVPSSCQVDLDCDDANFCTADSCTNGACTYAVIEGTVCDDGNACTDNDMCNAFGDCVSGNPLNCDDQNFCTVDSCDPALGCVNTDLPDAEVCDDQNFCTDNDTCTAGVCAGVEVVCDDQNFCTVDSCDPDTGCAYESMPNGLDCDDGDLCTDQDVCLDGTCSGLDLDCDDANECTADFCADGLCVNDNLPDGDTCTDGLCVAGSCELNGDWCEVGDTTECWTEGGMISYWECALIVDYGTWSQIEVCGPVGGESICIDGIGCQDMVPDCQADVDCDDTNPCTIDTCDNGTCVNTDVVCPVGEECVTGVCQPIPDCVDDADCLSWELCIDGECVNQSWCDNPLVENQGNCTGDADMAILMGLDPAGDLGVEFGKYELLSVACQSCLDLPTIVVTCLPDCAGGLNQACEDCLMQFYTAELVLCTGEIACMPVVPIVPECTVDLDCDDADPCTTNSCLDGACVFDAVLDCCEVNADCDVDAGEICWQNACLLVVPGECSPFGIKATVGSLLEWYDIGLIVMAPASGIDLMDEVGGACSVVANDFNPGECTCVLPAGEVPCAMLPASPGKMGCVHNMSVPQL